MPAEVQGDEGAVLDVGEHSRERPVPQHVRQQSTSGSRWIEPARPPQDLRQVAQRQVGREVVRRRQRRDRHLQAFLQVGHALIVVDQGPARLPDEARPPRGDRRVERDARAGHDRLVRLERLGQDRDGRRRTAGRAAPRRAKHDLPLVEKLGQELVKRGSCPWADARVNRGSDRNDRFIDITSGWPFIASSPAPQVWLMNAVFPAA